MGIDRKYIGIRQKIATINQFVLLPEVFLKKEKVVTIVKQMDHFCDNSALGCHKMLADFCENICFPDNLCKKCNFCGNLR